MKRAARRKPPKHLPKKFPDDDPLKDEMTPQQLVGQWLATWWRKACEEKQANWVHDRTPNVREQWGKARRVPVEKRLSWLASHGEDYLAEVEQAIHTDRGVPPSPDDMDDPAYEAIAEIRKQKPARVLTPPRPKGAWKLIFEQVRAEVQQEYGIAISDRTLKRCLDAYRRLEEEMQQEIDFNM